MTTAESYERVLLALTIWREARGEPREAKRGVAHVILNRVRSRRFPRMLAGVILQPRQFSSYNGNDPNAVKFPKPDEPAWLECCAVADDPGDDPTGGAVLYHSAMPAPPKWADPARLTAQIGAFRFYRG